MIKFEKNKWSCDGFFEQYLFEANKARLIHELLSDPDLHNQIQKAINMLHAETGKLLKFDSSTVNTYGGQATFYLEFQSIRAEYEHLLFNDEVIMNHNATEIFTSFAVKHGNVKASVSMHAEVPEADRQLLRATGNLGIGYVEPSESVQCTV